MGQSTTIVTAADAEYFPLLLGLVRSLHDQQAGQRADISVIDVGLLPAQISLLQPLVTALVPGRWDIEFPAGAQTPRWFQAMVGRPFLPAYFPGYEIYLWIDADAWIADRRGIDLAVSAATEEGLALVPEIHAAYQWYYTNADWPPRKNVHACYAQAWGQSIARAALAAPVLNSGMFAAQRDHPVWEKWQTRLRDALQKTTHRLIEQCALNLAVYLDRTPYAILPAWCNWICHQAQPRYNAGLRRFEEPTRPYMPISILHGGDVKHAMIKLPSASGQTVEVRFNYPALKEAGMI